MIGDVKAARVRVELLPGDISWLGGSHTCTLQTNSGVARADKVQQLVGVLAHERLQMVAGNVVPLESVVVEVVQDGQAGLVVTLSRLAVVRLLLAVSSGVAPVAGVALGGRSDLDARAAPEPSVLVRGLQVRSVTAGKVALPAGRPDVAHVSAGDALLDELVLLGRLHRDGVHAVPAADVPRVQPVHLQVARRLVLPAEEVRVCYAAGIPVRRVPHTWEGEKDRVIILIF